MADLEDFYTLHKEEQAAINSNYHSMNPFFLLIGRELTTWPAWTACHWQITTFCSNLSNNYHLLLLRRKRFVRQFRISRTLFHRNTRMHRIRPQLNEVPLCQRMMDGLHDRTKFITLHARPCTRLKSCSHLMSPKGLQAHSLSYIWQKTWPFRLLSYPLNVSL